MVYPELQEHPYGFVEPVQIHDATVAIGVRRAGCAARSGPTARRAEAVVIVTRQGQDPAGGLVAARR